MLDTGIATPTIALEDSAGHTLKLEDFRGKENVLIFFMRATTCPVCNGHVRDLVRRKAELDVQSIRVLIAVPEDHVEAAAWKAKKDIPFTVITGKHNSAHEGFGLAKKLFGSMQQSGTVLIDRAGVVRHAHSATMPTASYDIRGILETAKTLA